VSKQQVTDLVAAMRSLRRADDVPVLIDQEGGTVSRLKEPGVEGISFRAEFLPTWR